jgi:hypothetical protein
VSKTVGKKSNLDVGKYRKSQTYGYWNWTMSKADISVETKFCHPDSLSLSHQVQLLDLATASFSVQGEGSVGTLEAKILKGH